MMSVKKFNKTEIYFKKNFTEIINKNNLNYLKIIGYGSRSMLQINHEKSLLIKTFIHQEMLKNKILWNGIINLSYSHKMSDIKKICFTLDKTLKK